MATQRFRLQGGGASPFRIAASGGNINGSFGDILFDADYPPLRLFMKGSRTIEGAPGNALGQGVATEIALGKTFSRQPLTSGYMTIQEPHINDNGVWSFPDRVRSLYVRNWPGAAFSWGCMMATTTTSLWLINHCFVPSSANANIQGPVGASVRFLIFENMAK